MLFISKYYRSNFYLPYRGYKIISLENLILHIQMLALSRRMQVGRYTKLDQPLMWE